MNAGLTLGSLFDGIAGFPLAAGRHGIKTIWTSEIEPNCIDIAGRHFPDAVNLGGHYQDKRRRNPRGGYYQFWKPLPGFERGREADGA